MDLPLIVIANELGVDPADRAQLLRWSEDMMGALGDLTEESAQLAAAAGAQYYAYAQRVIDARRERPTDDLMSILVHAEVDGDRLQDRQIISESLLILNGGDETTCHVISGGVYELLRAPDAWEALRHDRTLIPAAIEEMLRWVSPIKNMARTATADVDTVQVGILGSHAEETAVTGRFQDMQIRGDTSGTQRTVHPHGVRQEHVPGAGGEQGGRETLREVAEQRGETGICQVTAGGVKEIHRHEAALHHRVEAQVRLERVAGLGEVDLRRDQHQVDR